MPLPKPFNVPGKGSSRATGAAARVTTKTPAVPPVSRPQAGPAVQPMTAANRPRVPAVYRPAMAAPSSVQRTIESAAEDLFKAGIKEVKAGNLKAPFLKAH